MLIIYNSCVILDLWNGGGYMFVGREWEINCLDKLYASDKFEFAVIYGRRRVGKTALKARKQFILWEWRVIPSKT